MTFTPLTRGSQIVPIEQVKKANTQLEKPLIKEPILTNFSQPEVFQRFMTLKVLAIIKFVNAPFEGSAFVHYHYVA